VEAWRPGKVTIISFCAFWCDTWKEQGRRIRESHSALAGLPVTFLTISVDGRWPERGLGRLPGPVLLDTGRQLSATLGVTAVPFTLVLDPNGCVTFASQGIVRGEDLLAAVRTTLAGAAAGTARPLCLTFDDFPSGDNDDRLLDILRAAGVRATFFCIGRNVEARPEAARRAVAEGHLLQVHSWSHNADHPELDRCARILQNLAGVTPSLYRPPGSTKLLRLSGGSESVETVNPFDYTRPGEIELKRRISSAARPGTVLLLHAGVSETQDILPDVLRDLKRRGITFGVLR
jgi:peptidoglycan/xylan/chitin deacetylase (PgdA/CDA1 family)